ncbi:MAG: DNA replication and repair protein RecF [Bacteroidetes bacterium CG23_combo_of_CG06-09_8_20_14_all_32_9]|nr:MAG: DNA replication and repair protein RecF [Bacteroidetes bacterium CG23_combo_of_CG06-09_8_20_14_all_32_9]
MNLFLKHIDLLNFKNFTETSIEFSQKINCFTGNNGAGKTNLLDAIYYLSFCKSYFSISDHENIHHNAHLFVINGLYKRDETEENIFCGVKQNEKKQFKRNKKEYNRLSDHIGLLPLVIVSPYDTNLIYEGSEERRKFINGVISQYDKVYLNDVINYNRVLKQRNALLKEFQNKRNFDHETISIYNEKLIQLGIPVYKKRKDFIEKLSPVFEGFYRHISGENESAEMIYQSQLETDTFKNLLNQSLERDNMVQYTTCGIHKDDLIFKINGFPVRSNGSQGQQKSFLLSLKLAQFHFIKEKNNYTPVLLLDDIFDKLDNARVLLLMKLVAEQHFGQIFITDTDNTHLKRAIEPVKSEYSVFNIENGAII